ncbi:MAG: SAM-dependent methyltransferase [Hyphomicrobiaceae bacterium]
MSLIASAIGAVERAPVPDVLTRVGIDLLVGRASRRLRDTADGVEAAFVDAMRHFPVALDTDAANAQHYELPPEFFAHFLGKHRKYSCCIYPAGVNSLDDAELAALRETVAHAGIADGQTILELGCGWGSLSLYLASTFPGAAITSVSNSHSQREFITAEAARRDLRNLTVVTCDMNEFDTPARFDRVVSVEMFEHMSNWRALLERARGWLTDDGRMFLHVFNHRTRSYRFDTADPSDWIAHHFFTGGIMPAFDLPARFPDLFEVEAQWRWSGAEYERTALDWLARFDAARDDIMPILERVYGHDAELWRRRWRLFFLATAGLFGHAGGREWGVGHYLLKPNRRAA